MTTNQLTPPDCTQARQIVNAEPYLQWQASDASEETRLVDMACAGTAFVLFFAAFLLWFLPGEAGLYFSLGIALLGMFFVYFWQAQLRHQQNYLYLFTREGGYSECTEGMTCNTLTVFRSCAVIFLLAICATALAVPSSALLLGSLGIIALANAIALFRTSVIRHWVYFTWEEATQVFIDHERALISINRSADSSAPLEEDDLNFDVFAPDQLLKRVITLVHEHTAPGTRFEEGSYA